MILRPPRSTRTDTLFPYTTLFRSAQRRAHEQLREVREKIPAGTPSDIAAFIDTHILMLDDRSITDATIGYIRSQHINAEAALRSEEHTSELQSLMRISYAVFCLKKKNIPQTNRYIHNNNKTT